MKYSYLQKFGEANSRNRFLFKKKMVVSIKKINEKKHFKKKDP